MASASRRLVYEFAFAVMARLAPPAVATSETHDHFIVAYSLAHFFARDLSAVRTAYRTRNPHSRSQVVIVMIGPRLLGRHCPHDPNLLSFTHPGRDRPKMPLSHSDTTSADAGLIDTRRIQYAAGRFSRTCHRSSLAPRRLPSLSTRHQFAVSMPYPLYATILAYRLTHG